MMGGEIGVESEEGQGSTFWFTAALEKQPERQEALLVLPADILGKRILVVDDNATNREVLSAYLGSWDCQCHAASGAQEALCMLREAAETEAPFHLVILDHMMPGHQERPGAQGYGLDHAYFLGPAGRCGPGEGDRFQRLSDKAC